MRPAPLRRMRARQSRARCRLHATTPRVSRAAMPFASVVITAPRISPVTVASGFPAAPSAPHAPAFTPRWAMSARARSALAAYSSRATARSCSRPPGKGRQVKPSLIRAAAFANPALSKKGRSCSTPAVRCHDVGDGVLPVSVGAHRHRDRDPDPTATPRRRTAFQSLPAPATRRASAIVASEYQLAPRMSSTLLPVHHRAPTDMRFGKMDQIILAFAASKTKFFANIARSCRRRRSLGSLAAGSIHRGATTPLARRLQWYFPRRPGCSAPAGESWAIYRCTTGPPLVEAKPS